MKEINKLNTKNNKIIMEGENIYNTLRNSHIKIYLDEYSGNLSLHDKICLSLYLSIIKNDNFYNDILSTLNYKNFTEFKNPDTNNYHYEKEFEKFTSAFEMDNNLELMVLYLLEYPLIKGLIQKEGYPVWKIKLAVYDYMSNKIANNVEKSTQKVLTKQQFNYIILYVRRGKQVFTPHLKTEVLGIMPVYIR